MLKEKIYANLPTSESLCNICFSKNTNTHRTYLGVNKTIFIVRKPTLHFFLCKSCGYSFCPTNTYDYKRVATLSERERPSSEGGPARVGDGITPGREFLMALGGINILRLTEDIKIKILIIGPGLSRDHVLLRQLSTVEECKVADFKNFQNTDNFISLDAKEKFDLIIACEVVEHFINPRKEFANLLKFMTNKSLLIISTNLRVSEDFSYDLYPFLSGHTSYYSFTSLSKIATSYNLYIDVRNPKKVSTRKGLRGKHYIYMTKSKQVSHSVLNYFSVNVQPLCE